MPLSARKVETAQPGKHGDGRGQYLLVKPSGARSWVLRYQVQGRRRDLGLGAYPDVSLAMARDRAADARRMIANGEDPITKKQQAKPKVFRDAALELIESKRPGWKSAKHAAQMDRDAGGIRLPEDWRGPDRQDRNGGCDLDTHPDMV